MPEARMLTVAEVREQLADLPGYWPVDAVEVLIETQADYARNGERRNARNIVVIAR